jgi:hypothetical protein
MRSDYPNADLINKVNSEWTNKVLRNPELGRAEAADELGRAEATDDEDDPTLQSDFTIRLSRMSREPAPVAARSKRVTYREPGIAVRRMARVSRHRSVARRVTERLVLGVAVLGLGAAVWMTPGFHDARNMGSATETTAGSETTPEIDATAFKPMEPAWLSPEILYATAIAPTLTRRAEAAPVPPRLGR